MTELNGKAAVAAPPHPTADQVAQVNEMLARMSPHVHIALSAVIRGLMFSFPGVAPNVILTLVCSEVAVVVAQQLAGDIAAMAQLRSGYRAAFDEGIRKVPIIPPAAPGAMPTNLRSDG